jgi:ATP-binding cassette, subfamily G (WHITE), member 2, PDR
MLHILTGLFNTFSFWMLSYSLVDMQNRLFSIFITLTISPPLIQQLQPRFIDLRNIFVAREKTSKIYSWVTFVIAAFVVEIPWSLLFGTIYFFCWYFGVGFPRGSSAAGYIWLILMAFEMYYVSFGQFMAAVSPNAVFATLLIPTLLIFVILFCGVVAPPQAMPYFWRSWMYCTLRSCEMADDRVDAILLFVGGYAGYGGA